MITAPSFVLITAPTQDVVTLDEAKAQLRIPTSTTSKDDLVQSLIDAVVAQFDPATGGWLGRALRPQVWEYRLGSFYGAAFQGVYPDEIALKASCGPIELPFPPLISITSVKYDDVNGTEQTLAVTTGYRVLNSGGAGKQSIAPPYNQNWPSARSDAETVRIRFMAGYDEEDDTLPGAIKQAVHLAVRNLYSLGERSLFESQNTIDGVGEKRWIVSDMASKIIRETTDNLLAPYRVW